MSFIFEGSKMPTLGVEIELQIIDPETLDLTPQAEKVLEKCINQGITRVKAEIHQSMIEIDSEISKNIKECTGFLRKRILDLIQVVEELGLQLGVTGTHPFQRWSERLISNSSRYQSLHEKFQWLARRMNVYGMHVHIGVSSGDRAIAVSQRMIRYLPHLLALSANSPYWQGIDTGMHSSRVNFLDVFPFGGLPQNFTCWEQFEQYHQILMNVGAIKSFKDLYWYVRPNLMYGTVEIRMCDAMGTLNETMSLVAFVQCLVAKINKDIDEKIPMNGAAEYFWIAPENQWIAARDGLEGMIVVNLQGKRKKISEEIFELVEDLTSIAKELGCLEELESIKNAIAKGNGASRQREVFKYTHSLKEVVAAAQKEFILSLVVLDKNS